MGAWPAMRDTVQELVETGAVPGCVLAVADVATGATEVAVAGDRTVGGPPMTRDSLFRWASITKPIAAAATLALVDRGVLGLDDAVWRWVPELADLEVVRTPGSPVDDVVPAVRPITVRHLLTFTSGYGFTSTFDEPAVHLLFSELRQGPPDPQAPPSADEWVRRLATIPLVAQPGERFLYNTSADLLGVVLARATGTTLAAVLDETILGPLGMGDTGFVAGDAGRMTTSYRRDPDSGGLVAIDGPDGAWTRPPTFASAAGGLVGSTDDWLAFGRMLANHGLDPDGRVVLSPEAVAAMTSVQVTAEPDNVFLGGHGWGFGGSVDRAEACREPWEVPGRYGWIGGTGTAGYVLPPRGGDGGRVVVFLSQVELGGADDFAVLGKALTAAVAHRAA